MNVASSRSGRLAVGAGRSAANGALLPCRKAGIARIFAQSGAICGMSVETWSASRHGRAHGPSALGKMPATDAQIHTCGKNTAGRAPEGGSRSANTSRPAWAVYVIATGGQDPTAVVATPVGRMPKLRPISIPTEPIGSIPRPLDLLERVTKSD